MNNIGKKIGLFGGTFDPVHIGHLIIADSICDLKCLDKVIFIPSARPPHKGSDILFDAGERFKLLSLAVHGDPRFLVSDIEMRREGPSYTIDTIREFKAMLPPDTELSFIVGMDNLYEIDLWKNPYDIIRECRILVAGRICDKSRKISDWLIGNIEMLDVPLIEVSSSDIRKRIREGRNIRYLVPDAVANEIHGIQIKDKNEHG